MKPSRHNKVLGLAIGETSLIAAEVVAGDKPQTRQLAEFVYPDGVSLQHPAALGKALAEFLRQKQFSAKATVVGLAARWLVVKPKEVPPADPATLADLLRLQAEGEFSSELKDLVYDYTADTENGAVKSVLLIATSKKYIDAATEMCEAARLSPIAISASAVALGAVTARAMKKDAMVLAVSSSGAELTSQAGGAASAIRHLRGPGPDRSFVSELRRAVSSLPAAGASNGSARELILWGDAGVDAGALGGNLGVVVRNGELKMLGIDVAAAVSSNGEGSRYGAAVALAVAGLGDRGGAIDFLHSRLAPPKQRRVPRWAIVAALVAVVAIIGIVMAYNDLQKSQFDLAEKHRLLDSQKSEIDSATTFVNKVSFAQAWHGGSPRYLACLRDLTAAIPDDNQTYATSVNLGDNTPKQATGSSAAKPPETTSLAGQLYGKTTDQQRVQAVLDRMKRISSFSDVKLGGTQDAGRGREVSFSILFTYIPPKTTP